MMKKYLKFVLLFITIFTFSINVNVYATDEIAKVEPINSNVNIEVNDNKLIIEDDASLLTDDEIAMLTDNMTSLTVYGNIAFKSISYNVTNTESYAANYYHEIFSSESGSLLLVDMDNRIVYIYSYGENYDYITRDKALSITDNIYRYLSNEEYYKGISIAFNQMETVLSGGKIVEPMKIASNIIVSVVTSFFIIFFIAIYITKIKSSESSSIIKNCDVSVEASNFVVTKGGVSKVYNPRTSSSSGGGSSGGGGGSSGGGGGGGGGHSF